MQRTCQSRLCEHKRDSSAPTSRAVPLHSAPPAPKSRTKIKKAQGLQPLGFSKQTVAPPLARLHIHINNILNQFLPATHHRRRLTLLEHVLFQRLEVRLAR